jgi:hypothetical protein
MLVLRECRLKCEKETDERDLVLISEAVCEDGS